MDSPRNPIYWVIEHEDMGVVGADYVSRLRLVPHRCIGGAMTPADGVPPVDVCHLYPKVLTDLAAGAALARMRDSAGVFGSALHEAIFREWRACSVHYSCPGAAGSLVPPL